MQCAQTLLQEMVNQLKQISKQPNKFMKCPILQNCILYWACYFSDINILN